MALEIVRIPALSDNYIWLIHDKRADKTAVVDPGDAAPVLEELKLRGWKLNAILNTHWHPDHTGGNAQLKAETGAVIIAPSGEGTRIPGADWLAGSNNKIKVGQHVAQVVDVPGHTAGHIAFHFASEGIIFVGDTLFAMGCGRLFEGTAEQMFRNMRYFATLPPETKVYCAHEYTQANGRFALSVEPDNAALQARMTEVDALREAGEPTVPTTIGAELATNPFLRAESVEQLAERRAAKDVF
ncbi:MULTISPECIES: hydroxyacylglutathione hydrolase [unclassified Sphingomonas]|uniref:hydroxyacylglutathione hydrolase n=1 Tax=unclassified Sphingomonas TaxID=196159 RepID=UPI0022B4458B|nr:hydroxyacylglutathione hydrolase [Sphingomonas sp. NIBR02145]WHU00987.1 hydroxyacylglutathione hydrolase [Sphingomonas sp. NIBR02145]